MITFLDIFGATELRQHEAANLPQLLADGGSRPLDHQLTLTGLSIDGG